jgi:hypothetical protein
MVATGKFSKLWLPLYQMDPFVNVFPTEKTKTSYSFSKKWINYSGIIIIKKINDYTECSGKQKLYAEEYFELILQ